MTTIAWDGTMFAADRMLDNGGLKSNVVKVFRLPDGSVVGGAGDSILIRKRIDWLKNGAVDTDFPHSAKDDQSASLLRVLSDGKILLYMDDYLPLPIEDAFYAIGSGRDFALAAMLLGESAKKAVEVASHFDTNTGMGVDCIIVERK